ncbi:hypothetical protein Zmor_007196 [Zophobas morio]|uniref:Selenoprotein S n=1 Tax=Zophobas morio TaxID=2755281 RepID=A0AA38IYK3_9CUCU|nr:hypothetical protein Zmor_007182 [Zophobas morio]KAJ3662877.1 hypothetical protein Zmor_007196 [Zophobas morio]
MESTGFEEESSWNVLSSVTYVLENYGWYLLISLIVFMFIYNKTLKSYLYKYKEYKFERDYSAKYHKNPDVFAAHVNAQQQWAEKMQAKYDREAEEHQRKMKEREERKRQELVEKYGSSQGGHVLGGSGGSKKDDKPTTFKQDYNPLMGPGGSSSYRAPKRSACGGGGCGGGGCGR